MRMQLELDALRASREQETRLRIAEINASSKVAAANVAATKNAEDDLYQQEMAKQ